jgi:acyl carrier protein
MKERLARYITEALLDPGARTENGIAADEDLLGSGLLDSLGVMSLVFFIEQEVGMDIPAEDVTIENFQTLEAIEAYLARRRARV